MDALQDTALGRALPLASGARQLQSGGNFSDYTDAYLLFFGLQLAFFVTMPLVIMLWRAVRSLRSRSFGFMVMLKAPIGRVGDKRSPAAALRFFLFQETSLGYYADVVQAVFSAISCLMFIIVSYSAYDPEVLQDIEFFFTTWFVCDYAVRLYIAQDSLAFFFSGVSLLDFITVVPAIVTWLMSGFSEFETNIQVIVQCIRVMRVFRIFRVIRVIRVMSVSQSYAFQRQVSVLVLTVLSLVFAAAGMFQILESQPGIEYPFTSAVYYAAITVIGRPGVGFKNTLVTPIFLTVLGMAAATIIPTFVAELIRLWYDNTALDRYAGNEETPHVIICGDNNASRLRVLVGQLFHASRSPNRTAPVVILAEGKPEGALRALLEEHKHSGAVTHVRGTGKRTADLRRAGAAHAGTVIVLNYRADRDAGAADTEVLSTVMAVKHVKPGMRVLAQLHRPRKRNALRLVPGWKEGDRAVACTSLGMTLLGLSTRLPGFSTLVTNLVRRSAAAKVARGLHYSTGALGVVQSAGEVLKNSAETGWRAFLYGWEDMGGSSSGSGSGGGAGGAAGRDVDPRTGRVATRTPMEEYSLSMEIGMHEVEAPGGVHGHTFAAVARAAYLRHGITLLAAALPVNAGLAPLYPSLPRTFKVAPFPAQLRLSEHVRLYALAASSEAVERWRVDNGGVSRNAVVERVEAVEWNPFQSMLDRDREEAGRGGVGGGGGAASVHDAAAAAAAAVAMRQRLTLNVAATGDCSIPWDWAEADWEGEHYTSAFLALQRGLGLGGGTAAAATERPAEFVAADAAVAAAVAAEGRGSRAGAAAGEGGAPLEKIPAQPTQPLDCAAFLCGSGILSLIPSLAAASAGSGGGSGGGGSEEGAAPSAPLGYQYDPFGGSSSSSSAGAEAAASKPAAAAAAATSAAPTAAAAAAAPAAARPRRVSLGDDGFGGIDDTDDIIGESGFPLSTSAPPSDSTLTAVASARVASAANTAALAVRLALPSAALASEDLTLVMPTATGTGYGLGAAGAGAGTAAAEAAAAAAAAGPSGHVIVCGTADAMGFLLRAISSLVASSASASASASAGSLPPPAPSEATLASLLLAEHIVLLSPSKPAEAALNAMYAGSGELLGRVSYCAGSSGDPGDLLRAGVMRARAAVILTLNKPAASADGSDNLSDDTEAILATAVVHKLNPRLHCVTELLHGSHAPFIRPTGSNLNDAQRSSFAYILEEREAMKQKARLDEVIARLQVEARLGGPGSSGGVGAGGRQQHSRLLQKLLTQQARLQLLHPPRRGGGAAGAWSGGDSAINSRATDGLAGGSRDGGGDFEAAFSSLSTSDIVDVIVGVREDFGSSGAAAAANDGVGFGGGSGGGSGGASKGSGATNDLFTSPAFAAGRVFSFATMDAIVTEAHFDAYTIGLVKTLVACARRGRLAMLPVKDAWVLWLAAQQLHSGAAAAAGAGASASAAPIPPSATAAALASAAAATAEAATPAAAAALGLPLRYGELFEGLLRAWRLLPVGLYRRVHPANGLKTAAGTVAALCAAAGPPTSGEHFGHNRALVSYVFTNPTPESKLSPHDVLYVLFSSDGEEEVLDAVEMAAEAAAATAGGGAGEHNV